MSEHVRESRPQFGFLSAVGLFSLAVLAVLVGLYFYNADIRQVGDGALDHARAYKRTIVSDYARFYECMRGEAPASSQTAKAEGSRNAMTASGTPSAPVVVYPPYADYPTYPSYSDAGSAAAQPAARHGPMGPVPGLPEYAPSTMGGPPGMAMPSGAAESGPSAQGGPMMPAGPSIQADSSAAASSPAQQEPAAQPGATMAPSMEAGPMMQTGPMMAPGPSVPPDPSPQPGPAAQPNGGMYAGPPMPPGYPPSAGWQGRGMSPSGMPPSGMIAPMPYGQGPAMPPPPQPAYSGTVPSMAGGPAAMYSGSQPQAHRAAPQGTVPPPPWSRYGYGEPGTAAASAPAVVPATPTLPMTSMMPPPVEAAPALPPDVGQVDPQIAAARQAAANQQHQDAIRIYRGYIARNTSDPSAFGELGNVLLSAGRPQEAAQAYYEASSRLIDAGQPGTVYLLLPHIEQHDPLLGAVLMRRLASLPRSIY